MYSEIIKSPEFENLVINSQLISFSMGAIIHNRRQIHQNFQHLSALKNRKRNKIPTIHAIDEAKSRLAVPVSIHFKHKINHTSDDSYPICVLWDNKNHQWNAKDCALIKSNQSHTICSCMKLATYALLVDLSQLALDNDDIDGVYYSATFITIVIVSSILVILCILTLAIFIVYCRTNIKVILFKYQT